jgi:hypothetical protein
MLEVAFRSISFQAEAARPQGSPSCSSSDACWLFVEIDCSSGGGEEFLRYGAPELHFSRSDTFAPPVYLNRFLYKKSKPNNPFSSRTAIADQFLFSAHSMRTMIWLVLEILVM